MRTFTVDRMKMLNNDTRIGVLTQTQSCFPHTQTATRENHKQTNEHLQKDWNEISTKITRHGAAFCSRNSNKIRSSKSQKPPQTVTAATQTAKKQQQKHQRRRSKIKKKQRKRDEHTPTKKKERQEVLPENRNITSLINSDTQIYTSRSLPRVHLLYVIISVVASNHVQKRRVCVRSRSFALVHLYLARHVFSDSCALAPFLIVSVCLPLFELREYTWNTHIQYRILFEYLA